MADCDAVNVIRPALLTVTETMLVVKQAGPLLTVTEKLLTPVGRLVAVTVAVVAPVRLTPAGAVVKYV